jgi:hypothetical protein
MGFLMFIILTILSFSSYSALLLKYELDSLPTEGELMIDDFENAASCWRTILADTSKNGGLLTVIEKFAHENTAPSSKIGRAHV